VLSNDGAECVKCGAQRGNYQYCINCGHDSRAEVGADVAPATPAYADAEQTPTVIDVFSSPEAKDLAEQLAALVAAQSRHPHADESSDHQAVDHQVAAHQAGNPPSAPATGHPAIQHLPDAQPSSKRSRPNLAVLLAAGLLAFSLAGVALTRAIQEPADDLRPNSGALVSAEDKSDEGVSADPSPERVVCWDGSTEVDLSACGTPEGLRGIAWVFPSIQPEECEALGSVGRPQAWSCPINGGTPDEASIVYGELFSVADGVNHYTRLYENGVGRQKVVGDRYVWRAERRNVRQTWQRSSMYIDQPWSVHIESATKRGVRLAFKSVEFRAPDELAGLGPTG
jgi:hypothetical protein